MDGCVGVSVRSMKVLAVLTCCAGHTSHSGDLLIQDIHCRLSTDHKPPPVPVTAIKKTKIKNKINRKQGLNKVIKTFKVFFFFLIYEQSEGELKSQKAKHHKTERIRKAREMNLSKVLEKFSVHICFKCLNI